MSDFIAARVAGVGAALAVALLSAPARATPLTPARAPTPALPPAPEALRTAEDQFDRLTVPVTVDGQGPFPFVVDTGADRTVLSAELAARLKLAPGAPVRLHEVAGVDLTPTVRVERLEVGARKIGPLDAPVLGAADLGGLGMLGVDSLQGRRIVMDFRRRRLSVEPSRREAYDPAVVVVRARSRYGQLVLVDASVGRRPIAVILDSGAQNTIGNPALRDLLGAPRPAAARPVPGAAPVMVAQVLSVSGATTPAEWGVARRVRVGGFSLLDLPIAFADLHTFRQFGLEGTPAMLLGVDVMRHFRRVTVDFARREVTFALSDAG